MADTRAALAAIFLLGLTSCIQARLVDSNLPEMLELNTSVVHELKMATFNDTLAAVKAPWALVEFYASWQARPTLLLCPACKAFKSHYERVAVLFNGPDAPYQDFIYVANLECWTQGAMCQRFGVDKYPIMVFGKPSDIAVGQKDETFTSPGLEYIDNFEFGETKKAKLQEMITTPLGLPAKQEKMGTAALQSHDVEEATSIAFQFIFNSVPLTKSARAPFVRFLHIVAAHHPSARCRTGGAQLLAQMDELWPPPPIEELGTAAPINKCGLWLLFHALVVRLDEFEAALWLPTLRGFIDKFFGCATCRAHFLEMADREEAKVVTSRRDAVVWLWAAHNEVNERLAKEEAEPDGSQGDPAFPKQQWPPVDLCPACQAVKPVDGVHVWDKDAVYVFLVTYYGNTATPSGGEQRTRRGLKGLTTIQKLGPNSGGIALGVPVTLIAVTFCGAALAVYTLRQVRRRNWECAGRVPEILAVALLAL
eukprot:SM000177S03186  [mRNA]  locus=s177:170813:175590:+ [translate_table: standard]